MDDKRFEHLIQSKLADYEANVPVNLWESIENELPRKKVVPFRRILWTSAAAIIAGIVGISIFTWAPDSVPPQTIKPVVSLSSPQDKPTQLEISEKTSPSKVPGTGPIYKTIALQTKEIVQTEKVSDAKKSTISVNENSVAIIKTENKETTTEEKINHNDKHTSITDKEYEQKLQDFENAGKVLPEIETQNKKSSSGFTLNLLASNTIPGNSVNHNNGNFKNIPTLSSAPVLKYTHRMPISAGITVEKTFAKNWGIETGLVYSYLHSDYKTEDMSLKGKQELHYLGIPVNINYRFARVGIVTFYASAGGKADFNIRGSHKDLSRSEQFEGEDFEKFTDNKTQLSVHFKLGASLTFYKMFAVYAEPTMGYYFDNGSEIKNIWKEKPLNFGINVGLRSSF